MPVSRCTAWRRQPRPARNRRTRNRPRTSCVVPSGKREALAVNINSISVLLGCAGLAVGGIGLLAQEIDRPPADTGTVQSAGAPWPPQAVAASVAFNDEMIELL